MMVEGGCIGGEIRALRGAAHQIWQWTYRVSCNEIVYIILNRFSGNRISRTILYMCV